MKIRETLVPYGEGVLSAWAEGVREAVVKGDLKTSRSNKVERFVEALERTMESLLPAAEGDTSLEQLLEDLESHVEDVVLRARSQAAGALIEQDGCALKVGARGVTILKSDFYTFGEREGLGGQRAVLVGKNWPFTEGFLFVGFDKNRPAGEAFLVAAADYQEAVSRCVTTDDSVAYVCNDVNRSLTCVPCYAPPPSIDPGMTVQPLLIPFMRVSEPGRLVRSFG